MNTPGRDPDEDVRRLLDEDGQYPGTTHDSNVLRAARAAASPPAAASRVRSASVARRWALAASVALVLVGGGLEWQSIHSKRPDENAGFPDAGVWIASSLIEPGLTRGQRDAPHLAFPRGIATVRLRLRMTAPVASKAFDAELSTSSGRVVYSAHSIRPIAASDAVELDVDIPAATLRVGSYVVTIRPEGSSEGAVAEDYAFSVAPS